MTKGIERVDARSSAMRLALRAIVDALADKRVIERSDITNRLLRDEQHLGGATASVDLIEQVRDLRRFLE